MTGASVPVMGCTDACPLTVPQQKTCCPNGPVDCPAHAWSLPMLTESTVVAAWPAAGSAHNSRAASSTARPGPDRVVMTFPSRVSASGRDSAVCAAPRGPLDLAAVPWRPYHTGIWDSNETRGLSSIRCVGGPVWEHRETAGGQRPPSAPHLDEDHEPIPLGVHARGERHLAAPVIDRGAGGQGAHRVRARRPQAVELGVHEGDGAVARRVAGGSRQGFEPPPRPPFPGTASSEAMTRSR